jgi:hypothetical protein
MMRKKETMLASVNATGIAATVVAALALGLWGEGMNSALAAEKPAPSQSGGALKPEHFAFSHSSHFYLDGPKLEASCPNGYGSTGLIDDDGNVWFGHGGGFGTGSGGRCAIAETGMIRPFLGDDYWASDFPVEEGPGSAALIMEFSAGLGQRRETQFVWGSPLKGGDKGFILFSDGVVVRKAWKNPDKDNRWWFKKIIGGGNKPLPTAKSGAIGAREAKVNINMTQVMPDGRIIMFAQGGFYEYKDEKLICLLGYDDYSNLGVIPQKGGKADIPSMGVLGGDGTFYMGTYFGTGYGGKSPTVYRVVPGGKLEAYAKTVIGKHLDGAALQSGGLCGYQIYAWTHNNRYLAADCVYVLCIDEQRIRRIRDGRVSTLCEDGEWRELPKIPRYDWRWAYFFAPGPNGMATIDGSGSNPEHTISVTFALRGIDWKKSTLGPLIDSPAGKDAGVKGGGQ